MNDPIGYCGLYCPSCCMYRAYHDRRPELLQEAPRNFRKHFDLENVGLDAIACQGCRSPQPLDYCAACEIRRCAREKRLEWCFQCDRFPCERLYRFESFWRMPLIGNLMRIREMGSQRWRASQEQEWTCNRCNAGLHWFSFGICSRCGHENPDPGTSVHP